tara:strand:+ start:601 stop:1188 length:588 start_codon:yes stop_codon:yes gene_type:complete
MSNIILRICGTFGSGKTTAVRKFLEDYPNETLHVEKKIAGYKLDLKSEDITRPVFVIGKYDNVCGGTDSMSTQQLIADRIMQAHPHGHVMYEGALVSASGLGGKVTQATEETGCTVYAFLDTPEDLCIERVKQRRLNAGNEKEFNPKNLIDKFKSVANCKKNLLAAKCAVTDLDHTNTHPTLLNLIRNFDQGRFE